MSIFNSYVLNMLMVGMDMQSPLLMAVPPAQRPIQNAISSDESSVEVVEPPPRAKRTKPAPLLVLPARRDVWASDMVKDVNFSIYSTGWKEQGLRWKKLVP